MREPPAPVVMHPRVVTATWHEGSPERVRLVVPAAAAAQIEELPVPDVEELGDWDLVYLDGQSVEVLNLADRKRWRVRLGQCGFGSCCCDAVAWPSDYAGPLPDPEPFDGWPFNLSGDMWDALAEECGRDVSELGWDDLLRAVAEARGARA